MKTLILARDMREALSYAQLVGLPKLTWRWVHGKDFLSAARPERIVQLPGFASSPRRWAIEPHVKRLAKNLRVEIQVIEQDALDKMREASAPSHSERQVGEQLDIFDVLGNEALLAAQGKKPNVVVLDIAGTEDAIRAEVAAGKKPAKKAATKKKAAAAPTAESFFDL